MQYTDNLNLKKPESTDFYDVDDFNDNFDAIDEAISEKATTATYTATIPAITGASTTVSVTGILATDNPIVDVAFDGTETDEEIEDILNDWSQIYRITTGANSITAYATDATDNAIPIMIKVVR